MRFVSFLENARRQPSLSALLVLGEGLGTGMADLIAETEKRYRRAGG